MNMQLVTHSAQCETMQDLCKKRGFTRDRGEEEMTLKKGMIVVEETMWAHRPRWPMLLKSDLKRFWIINSGAAVYEYRAIAIQSDLDNSWIASLIGGQYQIIKTNEG